ncbi:MAG: Gfo/Idh/MocA family oxidoreductase [Fimbriimonadaceae bacterium]|nr:Gfo/Idh/MocA family oxidoreductase [Fimbriimonadaceae bacterium]
MREGRIQVGVLGCGHLFHGTIWPQIQAAGDAAPFEIVTAYSPNGTPPPGARIAPTAADVIADPEAEAVWILGPAAVHAEQAIAALNAGKHVYVQKPMGTTLDEIQAVIHAAAESAGKTVVCAPASPAYPTFRAIRAMLDAGEIGPFYYVTAPFMGWGGRVIEWDRHPGWRFTTGSGPLTDHGIYGIVALLAICGPVRRVMAMARTETPTRQWRDETFAVTEPDNFVVALDFVNGGFGSLHEAWCAGTPHSTMRIHGLEGTIETTADQFDACPREVVVRGLWGDERRRYADPDFHTVGGNAHVWADLLEFADCIRTGRESVASPRAMHHAYAVIDAILRSAETGTAITIP